MRRETPVLELDMHGDYCFGGEEWACYGELRRHFDRMPDCISLTFDTKPDSEGCRIELSRTGCEVRWRLHGSRSDRRYAYQPLQDIFREFIYGEHDSVYVTLYDRT